MDALLENIKTYAGQVDEPSRRILSGALRDLAITLESPNDTLQRVVYKPLELMVAKFAVDIGLFKIVASSNKPWTIERLATETGADPIFLDRILRYLSAFRFMNETGEGVYQATDVTRVFATPGCDEGISFNSMFYGPVINAAPGYFRNKKHQNPDNAMDVPFQKAFNTDMHPFRWIQGQPEYLSQWVSFMNVLHQGRPSWTSVMNLQKDFQGRDPESPLFVDVGGGMGGQCAEVRSITKGIQGRVINQDLKETLDHAPSHEGVEHMAHDFFTPQPIKGAKYYFLRNIIHDYPDDQAVSLLKHLISAMDSDSVILINDIVIPNTGAHRQAVQQDIAMMIVLAAMERTESQWRALLKRAGLKIRSIKIHGFFMPDAIIEAVPEVTTNGHTNGYTNGHTNGYTNGHTNGHTD